MTIAFIVIAAVALIFLFIFNSRVARNSGKKNKQVTQDSARTVGEDALPTEEGTFPARGRSPRSQLRTDERAREDVSPTNQPEMKPDVREHTHKAEGSMEHGDEGYRQALRQFAGQSEEKQHPADEDSDNKRDSSGDELYREALRTMSKRKP